MPSQPLAFMEETQPSEPEKTSSATRGNAEEVSEAAGDGLCPVHDYAEQPPPYSPEQAEIDAVEAAQECQEAVNAAIEAEKARS